MRTLSGWLLVLLLVGTISAGAAESPGRVVQETWDVAYLESGKSGFVHTVVRQTEQGGQKLWHTTMELDLSVKRFNDTIHLRMETGSVETAAGKVVQVSMRQYLG